MIGVVAHLLTLLGLHSIQHVDNFAVRSDPTCSGAIRAFGMASGCRLLDSGPVDAVVIWRSLGIRVRLATFGAIPEGETADAGDGARVTNRGQRLRPRLCARRARGG